MEQEQDPAMQESANIKAIREEYRKGFVFVNKGLNTDELGKKEEARNYYKQGIDHLLKGVSIPSQGSACTGPQWDEVRQMQQKMRETLQNVRARLSVLDENAQPNPMAPSAEGTNVESAGPDQVAEKSPSSSMALPLEAPPAYTPEASDGHYTVSYGTHYGEFSSVGDDFCNKNMQPPPAQNFGVDADELILIPHGVQIFYVTPDGQVSTPSYPGYLRIVKFLASEEARAQSFSS
ncbi:UNVERIFIED_CONTAM: hypothetical protein K2H54_045349, partial [Gekko kuhli]